MLAEIRKSCRLPFSVTVLNIYLKFALLTKFHSVLFLLCSSKHTVLHQSSVKCTMHAFQTISISYALEILVRLEDEPAGIIHSYPYGMTPRSNGFVNPVRSCSLVHHASVSNQLLVRLNGNEIGMGPLSDTFVEHECEILDDGGVHLYESIDILSKNLLTILRRETSSLACPCHQMARLDRLFGTTLP